MLLARRSLFRAPPRVQRNLGSWAARFEAARGADLATRQALAADLASQGAWTVEKDEAEAKQMESESGAPPGSQLTLVLSVENTAVGILRAALVPSGSGNSGLMIGAQVDPALSLGDVGAPLIAAAREELEARQVERLIAVAPLSGLCQWCVAETVWEKANLNEEQAGAVEAVAKGIPRPGHSVLGVGTFKAAKEAMERLAMVYCEQVLKTDPDSEVGMFAAAGMEPFGINWMHANDAEALRDCAGCTVSMHFDRSSK